MEYRLEVTFYFEQSYSKCTCTAAACSTITSMSFVFFLYNFNVFVPVFSQVASATVSSTCAVNMLSITTIDGATMAAKFYLEYVNSKAVRK